MLLFIMLYKVIPPFKSVDETLVCDHLNESYFAVLTCVACVAGGVRERASEISPATQAITCGTVLSLWMKP